MDRMGRIFTVVIVSFDRMGRIFTVVIVSFDRLRMNGRGDMLFDMFRTNGRGDRSFDRLRANGDCCWFSPSSRSCLAASIWWWYLALGF